MSTKYQILGELEQLAVEKLRIEQQIVGHVLDGLRAGCTVRALAQASGHSRATVASWRDAASVTTAAPERIG